MSNLRKIFFLSHLGKVGMSLISASLFLGSSPASAC
jgi:hypothetical protein